MRARSQRRAVGALTCALILSVTACTSSVDPDSNSASPSPSTSTTSCAEGDPLEPPRVFSLTFDGISADTFDTTLTVPFAGLDSGPLDRPSVVRVAVLTSTSNAPVTFSARGGQLLERLTDPWQNAGDQLTTFSVAGDSRCTASVFLLATKVGTVKVSAQGQNLEMAEAAVVTNPAAAREVSVATARSAVRAGDTVETTVRVQDAFANPISGVPVVITTPRKGPGLFFNGARRAVVLTDENGQASTELITVAGAGSSLTIKASGDLPSCDRLINQYLCVAGEPVDFFTEAQATDRVKVRVRQPKVVVTSPQEGAALSSGQVFVVNATTAGVAPGTLAQVLWGDEVVALGSVEEDGSLTASDVPARTTSGNRTYQLVVGSLPRSPLDLTVRNFNVIGAAATGQRLVLDIAPGSWPTGTTIIVLRDGKRLTSAEVGAVGSTIQLSVPNQTGFYNVRVRAAGVVVNGNQPFAVLN